MSHSKNLKKKSSILDNILGFKRIERAYVRDNGNKIDRVIEPEIMDNLEAAKAYDESGTDGSVPIYRVITRIVTSLLNKDIEKPLLADFGSASARLLCMMAQTIPEMKIQGSELSDPMIELAHTNIKRLGLENKISVLKANCTRDSFIEPETADLSTSIWVAHHLPTIESIITMIKLMNRFTKTNGSILIFDLLRPPSSKIVDMLVRNMSNGNKVFDLDHKNSLLASLTVDEWELVLKKTKIPNLQTYILQPFPLFIIIYRAGKNIYGTPVANEKLPPYEVSRFKSLHLRFIQKSIEKGFKKSGIGIL